MPTDFESWWLETGEQLTKHEVGLKDLMQCAYEAKTAQHQGEPVTLKEAYEEGFSDGSRAGDDQYNWQGFRDELAKSWPVSDTYKLYAEQPAPVDKPEPVLWERMSKMHTAGRWVPCADKAEATGALMGGWEIRPLFAVPQPVGPFNSDTVVCRRYTQAHYPGQTFFHYDLEAVFDSVPVKLGDLLSMVGLQKWG